MLKKESVKDELKRRMKNIKIIDAHEHLCPESMHLEKDYNFYHLLTPYVQFDLYSAGMPRNFIWNIPSGEEDVDRYWITIAPLWKYVKNGSYARALLLTLKEFWDIDDITDDNYRRIGELLNKTKYKGRYREIIVEKCNIEYIINQAGSEEPFMTGHTGVWSHVQPSTIRDYIKSRNGKTSLDEYCNHVKEELAKDIKERKAILVKYGAASFNNPPDRDKALEEYEFYKHDDDYSGTSFLEPYICEETLRFLPELNMIAAVHTGVWNDVSQLSPKHLFPVVARHPDVTFDIYHMGMPYVRECGFLGKNYPNVYLNLCWSHIVSPSMTINALDEWLDFIPTNKIFGFGGDYATNPEKIWGHLQIAIDNLAELFAERIIKGKLDIDSSEEIIRMWLYDNPSKVYNL